MRYKLVILFSCLVRPKVCLPLFLLSSLYSIRFHKITVVCSQKVSFYIRFKIFSYSSFTTKEQNLTQLLLFFILIEFMPLIIFLCIDLILKRKCLSERNLSSRKHIYLKKTSRKIKGLQKKIFCIFKRLQRFSRLLLMFLNFLRFSQCSLATFMESLK